MTSELYIEWDDCSVESTYINYTVDVADEIVKLLQCVPYGVPYKIYASARVMRMLDMKCYKDSVVLQGLEIHEI